MPTVALPAKARATVYLAFTLIGLAVGAVQVGYLSAQIVQPTWLTVALAVVPFLGAGLGLTAASNTVTNREVVEDGLESVEPGQVGPFADSEGDLH